MIETAFWVLLGSHLLTSIGVGIFASRRGRDLVLWALAAMLITPPLAFVALIVRPDLTTPCPRCREPLLPEMTECYRCGLVTGPSA